MLQARKFPVRVAYGPERTARENYDALIVIERDREAGDSVDFAPAVQRNPRRVKARLIGCVAHVYAKSSRAGARVEDHEFMCDLFVDALIAAIAEWCVGGQAFEPAFVEARYLNANERNAPETWPGVAYRLRFRVQRGITRSDYTGEGEPTGELAGFANRTEARLFGTGDPVLGCGEAPP